MKNRCQPSEPFNTNAYEEEISVARTLEAALRRIDECDDLVSALGKEFITAYRSVKLFEFERFNQVISSWEREFLLLNV